LSPFPAATSGLDSAGITPPSTTARRTALDNGESIDRTTNRSKRIVVVGAMNVDTFLVVDRLPREGENVQVVQLDDGEDDDDRKCKCNGGDGGYSNQLPGGKGCTQAVAASRLLRINAAPDEEAKSTSSSEGALAPSDAAIAPEGTSVSFVGQFGSDHEAQHLLREALAKAGVHVPPDLSRTHPHARCGRGYVFLARSSGQVSAVVSGGSNQLGWMEWEDAWKFHNENSTGTVYPDESSEEGESQLQLLQRIDRLLADCSCVMLQREIPEYVNRLVASRAAMINNRARSTTSDSITKNGNELQRILVIQDVGGEDRVMDRKLIEICDYLIPNETEIQRLVRKLMVDDHNCTGRSVPRECSGGRNIVETGNDDPVSNMTVVELARFLQSRCGARNVLVTQGRIGSTLVTEMGQILTHPSIQVDNVVDETGAGDCYRAAFAVAMLEKAGREGQPSSSTLLECMEFASAAGACSVERKGAVPSAPSRDQIEAKLQQHRQRLRSRRHLSDNSGYHPSPKDSVTKIPRGDGLGVSFRGGDNSATGIAGDEKRSAGHDDGFPFLIASRLNSMKDRPDLWNGTLSDPRDYVERQSRIRGLTCVDFNYPQHFQTWSVLEAKKALDAAGLKAGAVCLRYPLSFARGAMNHPDESIRNGAIAITKQAAQAAIDLGCKEVVVWSAFDGYDYPFQVDYHAKWNELVAAFQECCDAYPEIRWSIEYKPTDENTRFFTVPSTGAALLFAAEVDRPNFGLTLDVGHMLMSGENPGQSIAMAGRAGKLFGIQLNDGYTRLAAEDGLMFGSVHPSMALEVMFQLRRAGYSGHVYFDTFPQRSDPISEAEYNIRRVKAFWHASGWIDSERLKQVMNKHDGVGALELVDEALKQL
jgi:sugar/nucleoside kinase (ribokinase family)/sugar phosphate isomerase/epimerase